MSGPTPYEHPAEHVLDEAAWARSVVRGFLAAAGRLPGKDDQGLVRGFAVTTEEALSLLEDPVQRPRQPDESDVIRERIDDRIVSTRRAGIRLPIADLIDAFDLDDLSRRVLMLALVGEVDEQLRRLYQFTWNDLTRRWPTMEFLLGLLQPSIMGRLVNATAFFHQGPLLAHRLIELAAGGRPTEPFLAREVRLAPSVVAWCIGGTELDPALSLAARVRERADDDPKLILDDRVAKPIRASLEGAAGVQTPTVVIVGPSGTGKSTMVRSILGRVLEVGAGSLVQPLDGVDERMEVLRRDARLLKVPLVVDLGDVEADEASIKGPYRRLAQVLDEHPFGSVITARDEASWFVSLLEQAVIHHVPLPGKLERVRMWRRGFKAAGAGPVNPVVLEAACRYPLSGGAIDRAVLASAAASRARPGGNGAVHLQDVTDACRAQLTPRLSGIAQRIVTTFTWDDLILPADAREAMRELVAYWKNMRRVYEEWGYGRLLPYGRGLSALFAGPPGTGKTMAAGIIGGELGMEVFRVDLSRTVSKYIGETEKNLGRVFDEAAKSQSILLFDEADSLFAKRTGVKSSIDRYANLEVNYLLQRMEDFDGVTILTTNLEGSLDDAFRRRIRFRVQFPAPDEQTRASLWARMVPEEAEVEGELDFAILAYDYDLSGGHIKNAALRAAFFAAERGGGIRMRDLRRAARLEAEKLGKIVRVSDTIDEEEDA